MGGNVEFGKDSADYAVLIDEESCAVDTHVFAPHELLQLPHTVGFGNLVILVGEQGKRKLVLFSES